MAPGKDGSSGNEKAVVNAAPLGGLTGLEKKKKGGDHRRATAAKLEGLIADLDRRAQLPVEPDGRLQDGTSCLEAVRHLHRLMAQVQKLEKQLIPALATPPTTKSAEERLAALEEWLKANNVQMDGLQLKSGLPEGCGVVATRDYKYKDSMAVIPSDLFMTTATAIASKADVGLLFRVDGLFQRMQQLNIVMHLLFERHKGEKSKWAGYIASLPGQGMEGEPLSPLGYSMEALESLDGTLVLKDVHVALRHFIRQYAHVRMVLRHTARFSPELAASLSWFSLTEFRWATMMACARQNDIPQMPNDFPQWEHSLALIPLLDLFNHEGGECSAVIDIPSGRLELSAKRDYQAGEQVFISYGSRENPKFFIFQGFVYDANEYDRIKLPVELPKSDPLYSKKAALYRFLNMSPQASLELYVDGRPGIELSHWLRIAATTDEATVTAELREAIANNTELLRQVTAYQEAKEQAKKDGKEDAPTHSETETKASESEEKTDTEAADKKEEATEGGEESAEGVPEGAQDPQALEDEMLQTPLQPEAGKLLQEFCQQWLATHSEEEVQAILAQEMAALESSGEEALANGAKSPQANGFDPLPKAPKSSKGLEDRLRLLKEKELKVSQAARLAELRILLRGAEYGKYCSQQVVEESAEAKAPEAEEKKE